MSHVGLGRFEYERYAELLGEAPDPALSPLARAAALPAWLTPELVCTEAARTRLRRWADCGRPVPARRVVSRDLVVLGLEPVRRMVVAAVRRTPPPVQHYLVHHAWFVGGARGVLGWTLQAPRPPAGPLHIIWLEGKMPMDQLWPVVAHECAHSWLLPTAPADQVPTMHERARAARLPQRLAAEWRRPDLLATATLRELRLTRRYEVEAARLARAWGFNGDAADPDHCAETVRLAAMRQW